MSGLTTTLAGMASRQIPASWMLPVRTVERHAHAPDRMSGWLDELACVRDLLDGLEFDLTTVFVGENGSGKSTLIEALATAVGLPPEGGTTWEQRETVEDPSELSEHLQVIRGAAAHRGAFFLRAETMHELMAHLMDVGAPRGRLYSEMSHGEFFIEMLSGDFQDLGLWILDEPESALSFTTSLSLLQLIRDRQQRGLQTIMATHSPVLAHIDGATIIEVGEWGLREDTWDRLDMVDHWRRFMADPSRYTRHFDDA